MDKSIQSALDPRQSRGRDRSLAHSRRAGNACRRCKGKKIKCHFANSSAQSTCTPCMKARADCEFDVAPDGIPRGAEYIAALETRIKSLEADLKRSRKQNVPSIIRSQLCNAAELEDNIAHEASDVESVADAHSNSLVTSELARVVPVTQESGCDEELSDASKSPQSKETTNSSVTIFSLLKDAPKFDGRRLLDDLPSEKVAHMLVETVFLYTQARYCIVDWVAIRRWHKRRREICASTADSSVESQTGAFFIWIVYAIGAQFIQNAEHSPSEYYERALSYLHVPLAQQNLSTVQALLALIQYNFRATSGPSIWHLVGAVLRLCVELGYHRKATQLLSPNSTDPYTIEMQKRFFWCAYCFDRITSNMARRPFGIQDFDIDIELPVNVNVTCTNPNEILALQEKQAAQNDQFESSPMTTITPALYLLQIYRLRSKITTKLNALDSRDAFHEAVIGFLGELKSWRQQVLSQKAPSNFPQQSEERIESTYFQAALVLIRPILMHHDIDPTLLLQCAQLAADACDNAKLLSLSRYTHNSPISVYNCFRCGITLLQVLAAQPNILPLPRVLRAMCSCSSGLSVFSKTLSSATPFLQIFDKLCDIYLQPTEELSHTYLSVNLRGILHTIASSDPAEVPRLLESLNSADSRKSDESAISQVLDWGYLPNEYDFLLESESMTTVGVDLVMPLDIYMDNSPQTMPQGSLPSFWTSPS